MESFLIGIIAGMILMLYRSYADLKVSNVIIPYIIGLIQVIVIVILTVK